MVLNIGNKKDTWPTYGFKKVGHLYKAATYWDRAEKVGVTDELIQKIKSRTQPIEVKFDRRGSQAQIPETDDVNVPLFDYFKWKIDAKLPVAIYSASHLRKGSTSGEKHESEIREIVKTVSEEDYSFLLVLRHMLDPDVARDPNRSQVLASFAEMLKPAYEKNSILGLMLSGRSFRKGWQRDIKEDGKTYRGFRPGDRLWRTLLPKTPLFTNGKVMDLALNNNSYLFLLLDELGRSGSSFNMFQGLVQMARKIRLQFDVVMGGHMPGAGIMQTEDTTYVAPGWNSLFDSFGKSNAVVAPKGGQGVILLPNEKAVFAASSFEQMKDMHSALTLKFGLTDKEKISLMRRKAK